MGVRKTKHPAIPEPNSNNVVDVLRAIKESLEIGRTDKRGDPLDSWITKRDLIDLKLASIYDESTVRTGGLGIGGIPVTPNTSGIDGDPNPGSEFLMPYDPYAIRPLPSRPSNVRCVSLWDSIMVKWAWPQNESPDVGWQGAIVWKSATPYFKDGQLGGFTATNFWVDEKVGLSVNGDVGVRYYWVAWFGLADPENPQQPKDGWIPIPGVGRQTDYNPYNWEPGVKGTTSLDPSYVLQSLKGQITESEIYGSLNDRINLIDYDDNGTYIGDKSIQGRLIDAVESSEDKVYAAVAEAADVSVESGIVRGEYNLRLDLNGYIVGFGLSAMANLGSAGDPYGATSAFVIKAEKFAVVTPGKSPRVPFIVGTVDGVSTVGIDGQLVVDGTITANSIQAGSIGAKEINAFEVWAEMVNTDRIISNTFATSSYPDQRLLINGDGKFEQFPLWFGSGQVGDTTIPGISEPSFFFEADGTLKLAGDLYVTGPGRFFIGKNDYGEYRLELGGSSNPTILWAGTGPVTTDPESNNWIFYIDKNGDAKFKGTVEAEFVSGEISRTKIINDNNRVYSIKNNYTSVSSIPTGSFNLVGNWMLPAPPFQSGHVPQLQLTLELSGSGQKVGVFRVLFKSGSDGAYQEIKRFAFDIYNYGEAKTIMITAPARVVGVSYFRLEIAGFDGSAPSTGWRNGMIVGIR